MMSGDPPDFTKDVSLPSRSFNNQLRGNQPKFNNPLIQNSGPTKFTRNVASPSKPNTSNYNNNNNNTVYSRLGPRNFYRNNNGVDNFKNNNRSDCDNRINFNRKRHSEGNEGYCMPKKRWNNKRPQYHQNNSAQNRLDRIRSQTDLSAPNFDERRSLSQPVDANDSQDIDATDITVEVINHNAQPKEESDLARFKMILDPKTQAAIRVIQSKRRDKQVIFPFPVTPNVTEISLHERFTML